MVAPFNSQDEVTDLLNERENQDWNEFLEQNYPLDWELGVLLSLAPFNVGDWDGYCYFELEKAGQSHYSMPDHDPQGDAEKRLDAMNSWAQATFGVDLADSGVSYYQGSHLLQRMTNYIQSWRSHDAPRIWNPSYATPITPQLERIARGTEPEDLLDVINLETRMNHYRNTRDNALFLVDGYGIAECCRLAYEEKGPKVNFTKFE
jgi:hypothetical protein